jgi:hypothetical protein
MQYNAMPCNPLGPKTRYSDNATLTRREFSFVLSPAVTSRQSDTFRIAPQTHRPHRSLLGDSVTLRYVTLLISDSVSIVEYLSPSIAADIGALPALPALLIGRVDRETPMAGEKDILVLAG